MGLIKQIELEMLEYFTLAAPVDEVRALVPYDLFYWADDADIDEASSALMGEHVIIEISGRGKCKIVLSLLIGSACCALKVDKVMQGDPVRVGVTLSASDARTALYDIIKWAAPHRVYMTTSDQSSSA